MNLAGFIEDAQHRLQREYVNIQSRRTKDKLDRSRLEDPGTAGDQGEENWAHLLREWLPSYFEIVTKGRILLQDGSTSPQVDVIVLSPTYPKFLIKEGRKHYLAAGVAAAFECKLTGRASHIEAAFRTAAVIAAQSGPRFGKPSPHRNVNSIPFGLLCHTFHGSESVIESRLVKCMNSAVSPRHLVDFVCVANKGSWNAWKRMDRENWTGPPKSVITSYPTPNDRTMNPVGRFLTALYYRLARDFPEMREVAWELGTHAGDRQLKLYFGEAYRYWAPQDCFSPDVLSALNGGRISRQFFSPWYDSMTHLF